jgi:hypothetical protein
LNKIFVLIIIFFSKFILASDTIPPFSKYNNNWVWAGDFGYNTGPFSLKYKAEDGSTMHLKYRNNIRPALGVSVNYKWFSLRLSHAVFGDLKSEDRFGKSDLFNIGFDFSTKRSYTDVMLFNYRGYALLNAYDMHSSLNFPNQIMPEIRNISFSINSWFFKNKDFKMAPLRGKTARYNKEVKTIYLRSTFNIHGVTNPSNIIPDSLSNSFNSKTESNYITALDFGVIPGFAYVNTKNYWQYSAMAGFGPVLQNKFYEVNGTPRTAFGLAPRFDIRLIAGYNRPRYFVMLLTEFDNKSIRFYNFKYRSTFYTVRIMAGVRLRNGKKDKW